MSKNVERDRSPAAHHAVSARSDEGKEKILSVALENLVMIDGKVYGIEDGSQPEISVDCLSKIRSCKAICCSFVFALTQEEVKKNFYKYNPFRPYYMAKDPDGFCPYLDRGTFLCSIHDRRPLRCRKYSCESDVCRVPRKE